jgi:hypothetical protein
MQPKFARNALLGITGGVLSGCAAGGAPSFELFGAFFPAWMLCAGVGIVGALTARVILSHPGLATVVPYQLPVCTALGLIVALIFWLLVFR